MPGMGSLEAPRVMETPSLATEKVSGLGSTGEAATLGKGIGYAGDFAQWEAELQATKLGPEELQEQQRAGSLGWAGERDARAAGVPNARQFANQSPVSTSRSGSTSPESRQSDVTQRSRATDADQQRFDDKWNEITSHYNDDVPARGNTDAPQAVEVNNAQGTTDRPGGDTSHAANTESASLSTEQVATGKPGEATRDLTPQQLKTQERVQLAAAVSYVESTAIINATSAEQSSFSAGDTHPDIAASSGQSLQASTESQTGQSLQSSTESQNAGGSPAANSIDQQEIEAEQSFETTDAITEQPEQTPTLGRTESDGDDHLTPQMDSADGEQEPVRQPMLETLAYESSTFESNEQNLLERLSSEPDTQQALLEELATMLTTRQSASEVHSSDPNMQEAIREALASVPTREQSSLEDESHMQQSLQENESYIQQSLLEDESRTQQRLEYEPNIQPVLSDDDFRMQQSFLASESYTQQPLEEPATKPDTPQEPAVVHAAEPSIQQESVATLFAETDMPQMPIEKVEPDTQPVAETPAQQVISDGQEPVNNNPVDTANIDVLPEQQPATEPVVPQPIPEQIDPTNLYLKKQLNRSSEESPIKLRGGPTQNLARSDSTSTASALSALHAARASVPLATALSAPASRPLTSAPPASAPFFVELEKELWASDFEKWEAELRGGGGNGGNGGGNDGGGGGNSTNSAAIVAPSASVASPNNKPDTDKKERKGYVFVGDSPYRQKRQTDDDDQDYYTKYRKRRMENLDSDDEGWGDWLKEALKDKNLVPGPEQGADSNNTGTHNREQSEGATPSTDGPPQGPPEPPDDNGGGWRGGGGDEGDDEGETSWSHRKDEDGNIRFIRTRRDSRGHIIEIESFSSSEAIMLGDKDFYPYYNAFQTGTDMTGRGNIVSWTTEQNKNGETIFVRSAGSQVHKFSVDEAAELLKNPDNKELHKYVNSGRAEEELTRLGQGQIPTDVKNSKGETSWSHEKDKDGNIRFIRTHNNLLGGPIEVKSFSSSEALRLGDKEFFPYYHTFQTGAIPAQPPANSGTGGHQSPAATSQPPHSSNPAGATPTQPAANTGSNRTGATPPTTPTGSPPASSSGTGGPASRSGGSGTTPPTGGSGGSTPSAGGSATPPPASGTPPAGSGTTPPTGGSGGTPPTGGSGGTPSHGTWSSNDLQERLQRLVAPGGSELPAQRPSNEALNGIPRTPPEGWDTEAPWAQSGVPLSTIPDLWEKGDNAWVRPVLVEYVKMKEFYVREMHRLNSRKEGRKERLEKAQLHRNWGVDEELILTKLGIAIRESGIPVAQMEEDWASLRNNDPSKRDDQFKAYAGSDKEEGLFMTAKALKVLGDPSYLNLEEASSSEGPSVGGSVLRPIQGGMAIAFDGELARAIQGAGMSFERGLRAQAIAKAADVLSPGNQRRFHEKAARDLRTEGNKTLQFYIEQGQKANAFHQGEADLLAKMEVNERLNFKQMAIFAALSAINGPTALGLGMNAAGASTASAAANAARS